MRYSYSDMEKLYTHPLQDTTEEIIERNLPFLDEIHWRWIIQYNYLSRDFLIKHINKFESHYLSKNEKIEKELIDEIILIKKLI